ncbi:hypothetical protein [Pseudomonas viridiflava]|uniref:hypothetical protein n=1 Tax=Pseudomonas viridiflava TaxID=33069 RepID=UPI002A6A78AD|nr:hypothetical protein [Pseudomonas viridiflava]MDY0917614.1 hypothetical protein [Pseudomonas viridiflava]
MNTAIVIHSSSDTTLTPPREVLCSVWPISQNNGQLEVGEPIIINQMIMIGDPNSSGCDATLRLPKPGIYLIDVEYSNGQSLRKTISLDGGQHYHLNVDFPKGSTKPLESEKTAFGWVPRVISAAPRRKPARTHELDVSVVPQARSVSLSSLYEFSTDLNRPETQRVKIFQIPASLALAHEISLDDNLLEPDSLKFSSYSRQWLMISSKGKPQTLVAYPYGWPSESNVPFKLIATRKTPEGRGAFKWSVSLKLMDPVFGTIIEHLTRHDLISIQAITDSSRGQAAIALEKIYENPFSMSATAYCIALSRAPDETHSAWLDALSHRYSWLPDITIALGWHKLCAAQLDSQAWQEARKIFMLACARGLPYYTVGLHILVDALSLLSRVYKDDRELQNMVAAAKAADVACVRTEPFTTLQVSRYLGLPLKAY